MTVEQLMNRLTLLNPKADDLVIVYNPKSDIYEEVTEIRVHKDGDVEFVYDH